MVREWKYVGKSSHSDVGAYHVGRGQSRRSLLWRRRLRTFQSEAHTGWEQSSCSCLSFVFLFISVGLLPQVQSHDSTPVLPSESPASGARFNLNPFSYTRYVGIQILKHLCISVIAPRSNSEESKVP